MEYIDGIHLFIHKKISYCVSMARYPSLSQKETPMDNITNLSTICQCLRMLGFEKYRSLYQDHRAKKLNTGNTIQLHVTGQLLGLESYDLIAEQLHANEPLRRLTNLESISGSALSRKTASLCTYTLQLLFLELVSQIRLLHPDASKRLPGIGKLRIIDATEIALPPNLAKWAYCSKSKQGIKMHTRIVVADPDHVYPDRIIATTADVNETEVALELVEDRDAIHVMDRGYQKHEHFERWTKPGQEIPFVARIRESTQVIVKRDFRIPKADKHYILWDRKVMINKCKVPLRLVVFQDEKGKEYYIVTNCFDVSSAEITQLYKYRWLIELFFKWIKQHLRLIKVFSYSPTGVWNQLYLALIAFAICTLIQLKTKTRKTIWAVLKLVRVYAHGRWRQVLNALERVPTRTSKGRQRIVDPPGRLPVQKKLVLK